LTVTTSGLLLLALSDITQFNGNEPSAATGFGPAETSNAPPMITATAIVLFDIHQVLSACGRPVGRSL
jgi:hypothetical protein